MLTGQHLAVHRLPLGDDAVDPISAARSLAAGHRANEKLLPGGYPTFTFATEARSGAKAKQQGLKRFLPVHEGAASAGMACGLDSSGRLVKLFVWSVA